MAKTAVKKRQSKTALSREKIIKKAIRLADRDGVEGLSMRKLARALKVEAMSLYNHVDNKEDLLDAMVDNVIAQFESPKINNHWKLALRACIVSTHKVLLQHPWVTLLLLTRTTTGDAMMTYTDASYGCLLNAGFSHPLCDHGWNALNNHLYGFTLTEINSPIKPEDYSKVALQYLPMTSEERYPYVRSMMKVIIDGEHSGINDFEFGLDLILNGLENKLQLQY